MPTICNLSHTHISNNYKLILFFFLLGLLTNVGVSSSDSQVNKKVKKNNKCDR